MCSLRLIYLFVVLFRAYHIISQVVKIMYNLFCIALPSVIYRVSQEECARLRERVPYVKVYRYNPKHLYPKLNGYGDNGQRKVQFHVLHLFS